MGRQTSIVATHSDEQAFLRFLRSKWKIKLFRFAAASEDDIWLDDIPPFCPLDRQLYVWNCDFPWQPQFGLILPERQTPQRKIYVKNVGSSPAIEFYRTDEENFFDKGFTATSHGRVYWSGRNDPASSYDVDAFSRWYDTVIRWLRRQGQRVQETKSCHYFYLPSAATRRHADS
jgi:hypothetical protein